MTLLPPPPTSSLSLSTTNASKLRSTTICRKLLYICYYYSRCFGMSAFGIKRCNLTNTKSRNTLRESSNISRRNNDFQTQTNSTTNVQLNQRTRFVLQAYVLKSLLWFHIVIRIIICTILTYATLSSWRNEDYMVSAFIYTQVISIILCPTFMIIAEIWHRRRLMRTLNFLFRLLQAIEQLHCSYEIFQWTHVAFVALKVVTSVYEIFCILQGVLLSESWFRITIEILQNIILIEIWSNLHVATLLYVCIEPMYGSLNHYMKHKFILRHQVIQPFGLITSSTQVDQLTADLAKFIRLYKKVHLVGLELHYLWQIPVACTLVATYFGTISIIYYMIWQYFEADVMYTRYVPFAFKLVFDITLLSLTAHRAIKSSQLIGCMGLENVVLVENEEWHRQMEQFLSYINLYDFKLNCLGLFDITNAITLTVISGLLTSISIFIPFCIKTYRIQKFLENQNQIN